MSLDLQSWVCGLAIPVVSYGLWRSCRQTLTLCHTHKGARDSCLSRAIPSGSFTLNAVYLQYNALSMKWT